MIAVPNYVNPDEYLIIERDSPTRHEYRRGLVYAMAGGSDAHSQIAIKLLGLIDRHLENTPCRAYNEVKVNYKHEFYYYPDAFVTCDDRDRADRYIKHHPKLIAEVLSQSTERFDQTDKFIDYQKLAGPEEYVLISQDTQQVECRRCQPDNTWATIAYKNGDRVTLTSLDLEGDLVRLYRSID